MSEYGWHERLEFSEGVVAATCIDTLRDMIDGCVDVRRADLASDKAGVDYIAVLRRGSELYIDHKARSEACSRYWKFDSKGKPIPEIALETHSVVADECNAGKAGWTLDESKKTHYTLHTFNPADTDQCYLLPFQILRMAFRRNLSTWKNRYRCAEQTTTAGNSRWRSRCVFVPAPVVLGAISDAMSSHTLCHNTT